MFCNVPPSAAQRAYARRPHASRRQYAFEDSSSFDPIATDLDSVAGNLDLSIHHARSSFGNRFASLEVPDPVHYRDRGIHASAAYRRPRNSRGTKEAKRRRDVRRNRRKFAADLLDEQLLRNIDETLDKMNIHPSPPVSIPGPAIRSTTRCVSPLFKAIGSGNVASAPPQLPPIKLHSFQAHDFAQFSMPKINRTPSPPAMHAGVPKWCPSLPLWSKSGPQPGPLPLFFDFSSLPETKETKHTEPECQEMQLWSLKGSRYTPPKQSRFFPSAVGSKAIVKLPPTTWQQYIANERTLSLVNTTTADSARPCSIADAVERIVTAAAEAGDKTGDRQFPSAANLWHILMEDMPRVPYYTEISQRSSWSDESEDGGVSITTTGPPYELADNEFPYVHSNALVGHANEVAERHSETNELINSAMYFADLISLHGEGVPSYELSATQWPSTPRFSRPDMTDSSSATTLHVEEFSSCDPEAGRVDCNDSLAHFTSEQELFKATEQKIISKGPPASPCDLATFLSMGHVENCWCRECEATTEIVHDKTPTDDEGWLVWSKESDEITTTTSAVSANATPTDDWSDTAVEDDSYDAANCQHEDFLDWEEVVPCNPSHSCHVVDEVPEKEFLGYWDDGIAFARENEFDWIWAV